MYLILYPETSSMMRMNTVVNSTEFNSIFTTDMNRVSKALESKDVQVYSLNRMTRIRDVKVTYEEVTQEMIDG